MTVEAVVAAAKWLRDATQVIEPGGPVAVTYHPLTYGWRPHEAFLRRFATTPKKALLVGMNPGPWGMGQTGVPFGDVPLVGDWLGLRGIPIDQPKALHPKRPVLGWACTRREASGQRLWGELRELWPSPERALRDLLPVNHCPLLMFNDDGQNITPDKLRRDDRALMAETCDAGMARMVDALRPESLIGVGAYARECCERLAARLAFPVRVLSILHPSPASPLANRDNGRHWRENVHETFRTAGLL